MAILTMSQWDKAADEHEKKFKSMKPEDHNYNDGSMDDLDDNDKNKVVKFYCKSHKSNFAKLVYINRE